MERKLVLFDIDGTLLLTGGATRRAMVAAGQRCFGSGFGWREVTTGRLDPQLLSELVQANNLSASAGELAEFRACYVTAFAEELERSHQEVRLLPGVEALLDQLFLLQAQGKLLCGVLTGNLPAVATAKLNAAGLDDAPFALLACGDNAETRDDLVAVARQVAKDRYHADPAARDVMIVGDTPRDVECAHTHGCTAVAVATGRYDAETLADAGADLVLPNLEDATPFLALLGRAGGTAA